MAEYTDPVGQPRSLPLRSVAAPTVVPYAKIKFSTAPARRI